MEYQIEFTRSPQFLAKASELHWLRHYGPSYCYYIGIPFLALALCCVDREISSSHNGSLLMGFLAGVFATMGFLFLYQLFSFRRVAPNKDRLDLVCKITDEGVAFQSEFGSNYYKWKTFNKLWQHSQAWMFFSSNQPHFVLPAELLNDELKQFLARKIIEAGGKVVR